MKKALIVLLVALLSLSFVFANGSKESGNEKITLVWYQWFDAETHEKELKPIIEEFQKTHPNVEIELAAISNETYWDRLALDIASNAEGDILTLDTGAGLQSYYAQREGGAFISLDDTSRDMSLKMEQDLKKMSTLSTV